MDERIESVDVGVRAATKADPDEAIEVLDHVAAYDPREEYSNPVSNLADLDADDADTAQYAFADHVPSELSAFTGDPNAFTVDYDGDVLKFEFTADYDAADDFFDALDHVLDVTGLHLMELVVEVDVGTDITTHGDLREYDELPEHFVRGIDVFDDEDRTEVRLRLESHVVTEFETVDVLERELRGAIDHATEMLP